MMSKEVYCISEFQCDRVLNENAPITSRGVVRESWGRAGNCLSMSIILTPHEKVRKTFMGFHG